MEEAPEEKQLDLFLNNAALPGGYADAGEIFRRKRFQQTSALAHREPSQPPTRTSMV